MLAVIATRVATDAAIRAAPHAGGGRLAGLHVQLLVLGAIHGHVHVPPLMLIAAAKHFVSYLSVAKHKQGARIDTSNGIKSSYIFLYDRRHAVICGRGEWTGTGTALVLALARTFVRPLPSA